MNVINKLVFFSFLLASLSCNDSKVESEYNGLSFNDLFDSYISNTDSTDDGRILGVLRDSLGPGCNWMIEVVDSHDTVNKTVDVEFIRHGKDYAGVEFKGRDVLNFFVRNDGTVLFQSGFIDSQDSLPDRIIDSLLNKNNSWSLPKIRKKTINGRDSLDVPHGALFYIATEPLTDSTTCETDWRTLRYVLVNVLEAYEIVRNDYSVSLWGKGTDSIEYESKVRLTHMLPIRIWININRQETPPTLPVKPF